MEKAIIIYGTASHHTVLVAPYIADILQAEGLATDLNNLSGGFPAGLADQYSVILLGCSGMDAGRANGGWPEFFERLNGCRLSGLKAAVFGCADGHTRRLNGQVESLSDSLRLRGVRMLASPLIINGDPLPYLSEIQEWTEGIALTVAWPIVELLG